MSAKDIISISTLGILSNRILYLVCNKSEDDQCILKDFFHEMINVFKSEGLR